MFKEKFFNEITNSLKLILYNHVKEEFREEMYAHEVNPIQAGLFWNHIGWGGHIVPPLCFSSICYPITTKLGMLVLWHKISQKQ